MYVCCVGLQGTFVDSSDAKYYAKVFEKIKSNPSYPMTEKHRLEAIVAKANMAADK